MQFKITKNYEWQWLCARSSEVIPKASVVAHLGRQLNASGKRNLDEELLPSVWLCVCGHFIDC